MLFEQFALLGILILVGVIVLSLRRKAQGTRTGYKIMLLLLGILLGITLPTILPFSFDGYFLKSISVFLLVVLLFELSIRLNPDNISLSVRNVSMFFVILGLNMLILGIIGTLLFGVPVIHAVIFAMILSSVEYFLVDSLKGEGDFANPLVLFFSFSILAFYGLEWDIFSNMVYFIKYLFIGIGMGVFAGIIVFKCMRNKQVTFASELGLIAVAVSTYIITEQLSGSGLLSVMILGTFYGNSYIRKVNNIKSLSSPIFKTLEMLIYMLIGFVVVLDVKGDTWWRSLVFFCCYIIVRFVVLHLYFRHYSFSNKALLVFAPKGMILGVMILVLGTFNTFDGALLDAMLFVLCYSLLFGIAVEFIEQQREIRIDKTIKILSKTRFGRKRNIFRRRRV